MAVGKKDKGAPHSPLGTVRVGVDLLESLLGRQPAGDISHKPSSRLPLLSAKPAVTFPASERHRPWTVTIHTAW